MKLPFPDNQPHHTGSSIATMDPNQAARNLSGLLGQAGNHVEEVIQRTFEANVQKNKAYQRRQAEIEVYGYADTPAAERDALEQIQKMRKSGMVSKGTQIATLKGMILDYENGKYKKGLSALTALKAIELLNKMGGYDVPEKVEHKHEHEHEVTIGTFPVAEQPFKGELEPLQVTDIDAKKREERDREMAEEKEANIIDVQPTQPPSSDLNPNDW